MRIIRKEIPSHILLENAAFLAFLDIRPIKAGHTLVIPKKETDYLFDMADKELGEMMIFSKSVAGMLKKAIPCKKIGVMVAGLEVPHAHVHLVPIDAIADLNFMNARVASDKELKKLADQIKKFVP